MVLYFDVAVEDVVGVQELESVGDLCEYIPDFFFLEGEFVGLSMGELIVEIAFFCEFHD
jgi:hypothetical protein